MDENAIRRIQPHNNDAEKSVVACMLMERSVIGEIYDLLVKEDFYNPQYGILYENMVELYNEGMMVDAITLNERLRMKGVPEEISDTNALADILSVVPTTVNARSYAEIVRNKSLLRKLISFSDEISKDAYVENDTVKNILEKAEKGVGDILAENTKDSDITPINEITMNVLEEIEEAYRKKGKITGISTGFIDLDNMLTGLHPGELILVAARPAMGKTAFVLNIAHDLAVMHKQGCAIFSLEMSQEQLVSRMIAIDAMVDSKSMKLGNMSDDDWDKVMESMESISESPIYIIDNSAITISELCNKCRELKKKKDIQLIILDYLQLMSPSHAVESRQNFIAEVSRSLKNLARELKIPIIALSQLNRAVDSRQGNKPVLSDIRESGSIEQDADVVMFIYRDEYYNPETTKPQTAEIIIAKQRSGDTGSIDLRWIGKYTKFANPEKRYEG